MRIMAPVNIPAEVEIMVGSGADEIYCGVSSSRWNRLFARALWLNRRDPGGGNLKDAGELRQVVETAHHLGAPVHLTMNAPYYTGRQQAVAVELACEAVERDGVDSLIIGDPGLFLSLKARLGSNAAFHVSTVGAAGNREAIEHWIDIGADRIILPRHLTLTEMARLVEAARSRVELEAFVLNDTCVYEEGYCQTIHGVPRLGAFCMHPWEITVHGAADSSVVTEEDETRWNGHLDEHRRWLWYCNSCGCTMGKGGLPLGPCGLCAIGELARIGISSVKIVGREASTIRKMRSVQLVKRVLETTDAGAAMPDISRWARSLRNTPDYCDDGYMCYYREVSPALQGGSGDSGND